MATRRKASFYKILRRDDFCEKLKIPKAFLSDLYGMIPEKCKLRIGTKTWLVGVEMVCDRLYFQNGWKKFVQENRLKSFEFLTFTYNGNSEFFVDIFGADACKRNFSEAAGEASDDSEWKNVSKMEEANSDDTSVQANDDEDDSENEVGSEDTVGYVESDEDDEAEFARFSKKKTEKRTSGFHKRKISTCQAKAQSKRHVSGSSSNRKIKAQKQFGTGELVARHSATAFMSKSVKPSCMIVMTLSYVTGSFVHFPYAIANKHLNKSRSHINLRIGNNCWSASIYHGNNSFRLQAGWPAFVNENDLKVGDVCVFVLAETNRDVFDVTIFRAIETYY